MAITFTSTAYSATPRVNVSGVYSISFDYTTPSGAGNTLSASANASVVFGPRIQNGTTILSIQGSHSSGAATMPVDIGITGVTSGGTASLFTSQKASGVNGVCTASNAFPYKVSISDDAANQYATVTFSATPGTDTAVARFTYVVLCSREAN